MKERIKAEPKVWKYAIAEGWVAIAGKTDEDNDIISTEIVKPEEWWFHANAVPGSHVILRKTAEDETGYEPDRALILKTAAIAAYHSKARNAKNVPVCYTRGRCVRKERGAKAGSVLVTNETVVKVTPSIEC